MAATRRWRRGGGELVVASSDTAIILEAGEHVLNGVSAFVNRAREAAFPAPVRLGGDVGHGPLALDQAADRVAVIGLVGEYDGTRREIV